MIKHPGNGYVDAIGRRAIDEQKPISRPTDFERAVKRQGIGGPAAIALRRDHGDFPQCAHRLRKRSQARGKITIVITDQNSHGCILGHPAKRRSIGERLSAINCFRASLECRL